MPAEVSDTAAVIKSVALEGAAVVSSDVRPERDAVPGSVVVSVGSVVVVLGVVRKGAAAEASELVSDRVAVVI